MNNPSFCKATSFDRICICNNALLKSTLSKTSIILKKIKKKECTSPRMVMLLPKKINKQVILDKFLLQDCMKFQIDVNFKTVLNFVSGTKGNFIRGTDIRVLVFYYLTKKKSFRKIKNNLMVNFIKQYKNNDSNGKISDK